MLEVCFDRARGMYYQRSIVAEGMFRPCSRYVLTVLDRAKGMFRPCSSFVLTKNDSC